MTKDTVEKLALMIASHKLDMTNNTDTVCFQFVKLLGEVQKAIEETGVIVKD